MLKEVAQSLNPYVSCSQMLAFENQLNEQYLLRVLRKILQIKKKKSPPLPIVIRVRNYVLKRWWCELWIFRRMFVENSRARKGDS